MLTPTQHRPRMWLVIVVAALFLSSSPIPLETSPILDQVTVESHSRIPGAHTAHEITFVTAEGLDGLTDRIIMELHEDIGAPTGIRPSDVTVTYGEGGITVHGHADDIHLSGQTGPGEPTTITLIPHVDDNGSPADIPAGATVTVTFTEAAGISNPTEGGVYSWLVSNSAEPVKVPAVHPDIQVRRDFQAIQGYDSDEGLLVERTVSLSGDAVTRGEQVSVTARGYREGLTLWVWRDSDADARQADDEGELCQATVDSLGIGQCSFEVRVPPFAPGSGDCLSDSRGCNLVNAADGAGRGLNLAGKGAIYIQDSTQLLALSGRIEATAAVGSHRDLQVKLIDFPPGTLESVTVGGESTHVDALSVGSSGRLSFRMGVPAGVKTGQHLLEVGQIRDEDGQLYSSSVIVEVTLGQTEVGLSPGTLVANQAVALWGRGFSTGEGAVIREIRVGGSLLEPGRINYGQGFIPVDPDGSWAGTISLPVAGATTEEGTYRVDLVDTDGRAGSVEYEVAARDVTVTPAQSRPGSVIEVLGRGFPAHNHGGPGLELLIHYQSPSGQTTTPVRTDHEGNFAQEIKVSLDTPSPSVNAVRVEFRDDVGELIETAVEHQVLEPTILVTPSSGPPGTLVSLTGSGFRHHAPITSVSVGGMEALGAERPSTDAQGRFSLQFIAPGAGFGPQPVRVDVSGSLARAFFQLSPGGAVPGNAAPVAEELAGLGDRLDVVFHFDNLTKNWSFYDPFLDEESDLRFMVGGELYFFLVSETVEALLNGKSRTLTCREGNCWNVILW